MNLSAPFIERPVATILVTVGILLIGAFAFVRLPIASLPTVERPTIGVYAYLPGASADTVASSLAQPLERQLGTIPGIVEMTSYSASGGTRITIQFELSKDIDAAAGEIQAAINAAGPNLPADMPRPPTYWKANPGGFSVIAIALTSDSLMPSELYDLADGVVAHKLAQFPGVAQVQISGAERSAVRIRASPQRLASMNLSLETLRAAIGDASQNMAKGALHIGDQSYSLAVNDQLYKAVDYREMVIAWRNGAAVRLADVAAVSDGVINNKLEGWFGTKRGVLLYVYKQSDANVVETVDAVKAALPQMVRWLPPAVRMNVVYDRTALIRASIAEVEFTIVAAAALAVLVVALFLKRFWATVIPALTIPATLALMLTGMSLCGYSLDNLSLMAITIAIGFIVDDAVIVIEYVIRLLDEGRAPRDAALEAARAMGFTIVAISAVLIAALLPIVFMPDVIGRYFREFGMTIALAIVASALFSLTLTPMLCSRLLSRPALRPGLGGADQPAGRRCPWPMHAYLASLRWTLDHPASIALLLIATTGGAAGLYTALPKGLMPTQDTGILRVSTVTIPNVSFAAMEELQRRVARTILEDPAVEALSSHIGTDNGSSLSTGTMVVSLKPIDQRGQPIGAVIERLRAKLARIEDIRSFLTPLQDFSLGTQSTSSRYQYTLTGGDPNQVWRVSETMRRRMLTMPEITGINTSAEISGLEAGITIDRNRAAAFGVTPLAIDNTLYDAFGQRQVKTIYLPFNFSRVVLELEPSSPLDPAILQNLRVPSVDARKAVVPMAELMRPVRRHAAVWLRHTDQFPSVTLSFDTRSGVSIGQAIATIRSAEREIRLPDEVRASFRGEAGEANKTGGQQLLLLLGAVFTVYVVLGMLYESFTHPLTILSTLPSAMFGALLALFVTRTELTLVASIACVLLIGMVMKNGIMMVDFALAVQRATGLAPRAAILHAAELRARPILMTTLVAILSAVPLVFGTGPGHELRQPLGIAGIGGLAMSQLLTLYTTPAIYLLIERLRHSPPLHRRFLM